MKAWIGAVALLFVTGLATAQNNNYTVTPLRLELSAKAPATVLQVINRGEAPATLQVQQRAWIQRDGRDDQDETRDLIISPALFTFKPGETQVIRIALRGAPDPRLERAYRIVVSELPPPRTQTSPDLFAFRIALRMDLPLFVTAIEPAAASPVFDIDAANGRLIVRNDGPSHIRFTNVALLQAGRQFHAVPVFTVLPVSSVILEMPKDRVPPGSTVRVEADSNAGPITRDVPVR